MSVALKKEPDNFRRSLSGKNNALVDQAEQFSLLKRPGADEVSKLREFFYALVGKTGKEQRRRVSIALARCVYTPRAILIFLALDEIDIASPILLFSPVLKDSDLLNILEKAQLDHARVIARRDNIGDKVIRSLMQMDDEKLTIKKIMEQNKTLKSNLRKTDKSGNNDDKPNQITPALSSSATLGVSKPKIPEPSKALKEISENLLSLANTGGKIRKDPRPRTDRHSIEHDENFEQKLIALAREWRPSGLCRFLSLNCGLKANTILGYVENKDVGKFASLLSVLGVKKVAAGRVLLLQFPQIGQNKTVFSNVLERYEKLDTCKALQYFTSLEPEFGITNENSGNDPQSETLGRLLEGRRRSIQDSNKKTGRHDVAENLSASA
ncbi:MAG: DUF2336 domain-containing protein [Rhizobiaceae bacterium]